MQQEKAGFSVRDVPEIVQEIEAFCRDAEERAPVLKTLWGRRPRMLDEIQEKISQGAPTSRVAVIGSIKSGKSTCVNALLGSDILRRGAGTLTSAVTRVVPAPIPRATITWKGWKAINAEAGFAAALLAGITGPDALPEDLDLREEAHREAVQSLLERTDPSAAALPRHALNHLARLRALLAGYTRIRAHLKEDPSVLVLEREWFQEHREIVTSDDSAAYVEDVLVEVPFPDRLPPAEIADCQGSDSLNPSHLVDVQEYLLHADWAVYMISSVMGLREAYEKLLDVVRGLGLADHTVFLLNTEIDAHGSLDDLRRVQGSVESFLAGRFGNPRLYTASVLLELYTHMEGRSLLSPRETERLESWCKDPELPEALRARWGEFMTFWRDEIAPAAGRFQRAFARRALTNATAWLRQGLRIASNPYDIDLDTLQVCSVEGKRLRPNMEAHLEGTAMKMETLVRNRLDSLLYPSFSDLGKAVKEFIQGYTSRWDPASAAGSGIGMNRTGMALNLAEEFNQALHLFLLENVNPEIAGQVRALVQRVQQEFTAVVEMYGAVLTNNYLKMSRGRRSPGPAAGAAAPAPWDGAPASADVRELLGNPHVDLFTMKLELTLGRKTLAAAHQGWMLSFRKFTDWVGHRVFRKDLGDEDEVRAEVMASWRDTMVASLRKEARGLMRREMFRYREHVKYQVLIRYVRDLVRACKEDLGQRFDAFEEQVERARQATGVSDRDLAAVRDALKEWEERLQRIEARIHG